MYKKKHSSFSNMFYTGFIVLFLPIIGIIGSIVIGNFFISHDSKTPKSKKDSVEIKTKTVIVYDTVKVYKSVKKKKKKTDSKEPSTKTKNVSPKPDSI